jgi:uncharacterized membrane protein HdeD (DUF308 family)
MLTTENIAEKGRTWAIANGVAAFAGLFMLGFPLTPTAIKTTLVGWALTSVTTLQVVHRNIQAACAALGERK